MTLRESDKVVSTKEESVKAEKEEEEEEKKGTIRPVVICDLKRVAMCKESQFYLDSTIQCKLSSCFHGRRLYLWCETDPSERQSQNLRHEEHEVLQSNSQNTNSKFYEMSLLEDDKKKYKYEQPSSIMIIYLSWLLSRLIFRWGRWGTYGMSLVYDCGSNLVQVRKLCLWIH